VLSGQGPSLSLAGIAIGATVSDPSLAGIATTLAGSPRRHFRSRVSLGGIWVTRQVQNLYLRGIAAAAHGTA
jgi:hypothetical protein